MCALNAGPRCLTHRSGTSPFLSYSSLFLASLYSTWRNAPTRNYGCEGVEGLVDILGKQFTLAPSAKPGWRFSIMEMLVSYHIRRRRDEIRDGRRLAQLGSRSQFPFPPLVGCDQWIDPYARLCRHVSGPSRC